MGETAYFSSRRIFRAVITNKCKHQSYQYCVGGAGRTEIPTGRSLLKSPPDWLSLCKINIGDMRRITIEIEQERDLQLLLLLAQRIGARVIMPVTEEERQKHLRIVAQGSPTAAIDDPMQWQRDIRKDRELPFRE
jgi:hypothetical protein